MKWSNLKINKCPQCNKDFASGLKVESNMAPVMFTHKCGFKISEYKFREIVFSMNEKEIEKNSHKE